MQNRLSSKGKARNIRMTITTAEMPSGSLGIVIAGPDLSGRSNLREAGWSRAIGFPYQVSSSSAGVLYPLDGDGQGEGEPGKARLKSKMRWDS